MTRFCLLCAGALCLVSSLFAQDAAPPKDTSVNRTLAVQIAMRRAGHLLLENGGAKPAVELLEEQLPYINGNDRFLQLLKDSYRKHIQELWLAQQSKEAIKFYERLVIIDPDAANDAVLRGGREKIESILPGGPSPASSASVIEKPASNKVTVPAEPRPTTVRAKGESSAEEAFELAASQNNAGPTQRRDAKELIAQAEAEFSKQRYVEANKYYEQAFQADQKAVEPIKERWAYCMLRKVWEQINAPNLAGSTPAELQRQVHGAVSLAPVLDNVGKKLLKEIADLQLTQTTGTGPDTVPEATLTINHLGRNEQGWQVSETTHFRIFHNQPKEFVEKAAQSAEKTRQAMYRKWFGTEGPSWTPKCDLVLHATAGDYSRITGVPATSPGHSRIESDPSGQRIVQRRMDMHCDSHGMLETVLPHETTHVVLAGMFDHYQVPRWADEGMAVLTEPMEKIEQHRRNLFKAQRDNQLFAVRELLVLADYPSAKRISAFYAQSVFLVEFLSQQKGPIAFSEFLRDGLRGGYETALRRHYGWSVADLETRWNQYLQGESQRLASR